MGCQVDEGICAIFYTHTEGVFGCETVFDADEYSVHVIHHRCRPSRIICPCSQCEASTVEVNHDRESMIIALLKV